MRKYIKLVLVLSTIFFAVHFYDAKVFAGNSETEKYERDYLSKIFDSENGLEGTTAKCICADSDGFLWLGGYTGLYRYDGNEFEKFLMDGRALPVNDLVQDLEGNLWIGTNGDGVYRFDGKNFQEYKLDNEVQGTSVVNKLYLDQAGIVWVGTKGGLFSIDAAEEADTAKEYRKFSNSIIQDIGELSTGEKIIIQKSGGVYLLDSMAVKRLALDSLESDGVPRCCYGGEDGSFYLGTTGNIVLKISAEGKVLNVIDGSGLSSFNEIYPLNDSQFWICSDTGIGILKDNSISRLDLDFGESIEEGCEDYQGKITGSCLPGRECSSFSKIIFQIWALTGESVRL